MSYCFYVLVTVVEATNLFIFCPVYVDNLLVLISRKGKSLDCVLYQRLCILQLRSIYNLWLYHEYRNWLTFGDVIRLIGSTRSM